MRMKPNYTKIYLDLIKFRKKDDVISDSLLEKINNIKIVKDVLEIERELFKNDNSAYNQKLRCYDEKTVKSILEHQRLNKITNTELGQKYKVSRNTIAKWRKIYSI
ncbi:hypothetical protein LUD75_13420 [Epilithonimonas sp. JDS]|uniref:hypothetical protein n=1 Tax=Epilithonimonas sp. JDS TaxID=2902797 RepID=UPI001E282F6A|nr:hypothetical protein [Epilithonimonas sp. JDS]MCD9855717.1 hypothetical protein [Epilithonimonas sp. JDS]